jgi:hypothetical protein
VEGVDGRCCGISGPVSGVPLTRYRPESTNVSAHVTARRCDRLGGLRWLSVFERIEVGRPVGSIHDPSCAARTINRASYTPRASSNGPLQVIKVRLGFLVGPTVVRSCLAVRLEPGKLVVQSTV